MKAGNVVRFPRGSSESDLPVDVLEAARLLSAVAQKVEDARFSDPCKAAIFDDLLAIGSRLKNVVETIRDEMPEN